MHTSRVPSARQLAVASVLSLAGVLASGEAAAQTSVDRSFDPAPKDCSDVRWSQAALQAFPSIGEACQSVEERNGKTYVKLEGTVEEVRDAGKRIRVDFEDGRELTFTPTPRTVLYLDGERTSFGELDRGTELNFYIPEDRLQAELQPDPNRFAFVIVPIEIPTATFSSRDGSAASERGAEGSQGATAMNRRSELPQTAGPLPLLGTAGLLLILSGAAATCIRKLRSSR